MSARARSFRMVFHAFLGIAIFSLGALSAEEIRAEEVSDAVLLATEKMELQQNVQVSSGDLVVNEASRELKIQQNVVTSGTSTLKADKVKIDQGSTIGGDVFTNDLDLDDDATIVGDIFPLGLPVFLTLPPAEAVNRDPNAPDVEVAEFNSLVLAPGDYGEIKSKQDATIIFSGGVYQIDEMKAEQRSTIHFASPTVLVIEEKLEVQQDSFFGPSPTSGITAASILVEVVGAGKEAKFQQGTELQATVYVPTGKIEMQQNVIAVGAFLAREIKVQQSTQISLNSAFRNIAPVVVGESFQLPEGETIVGPSVLDNDFDLNPLDSIALTLLANQTQAVSTGPSNGSLTFNPDGTFIYTHDGGQSITDSFTYEVCDDGDPILCSEGTVTFTIDPVNDAPTANPQDTFTNGIAPLILTLTGSDPEADDLTFSIVTPPTNGTLSAVSQDPPPSPGNPPGCNPSNTPGCTPGAPPRTNATVTYTPNSGDNLPDSLTFQVNDGDKIGTANVLINPANLFCDDGISTPPCNPDPSASVVDAQDVSTEAATDTTVTVMLSADAPDGVNVTFSVLSLPTNGGTLQDAAGQEIGTVPAPLSNPVVQYTPPIGFTGTDSFLFEAAGDNTQTDMATASIIVATPPKLAEDIQVTTEENVPVVIDLAASTNVAKSLAKTFRISAKASSQDGAEIAGNVSDTDGDGDGDDTNSSTLFMSAAIEDTAGCGSSSGTFNDETTFLAELCSSTTFDFEQSSGFPPASAVIGTVDDVDFFGRIGFAVNPPPPSGNQFMRGTGPSTPYDDVGFIDFSGLLPTLPNAVGFTTGFSGIASPAPFVRVRIFSGSEVVVHEEFIPHNAPNGTYFGYIDTSDDILGIEFQGVETDLVTEAVAQQFGIDDLTIGTHVAGTPGTLVWTLNGVTFADSTIASGFFVLNTTTQAITNWNIATFNGTVPGDFTYTPSNSSASRSSIFGDPQPRITFQSNDLFGPFMNSFRQLRVTPTQPLTSAGGSVPIDLNTLGGGSGSIECINCGPFRLITAGSLSAPTPSTTLKRRIQIEWDVMSLAGTANDIEKAEVILSTHKGTIDSLDTFFFVGTAEQDGLLTNSDFEAPAEQIPTIVMPVPAVPNGTDGTFTFDVTSLLQDRLLADTPLDVFSIQGRVDETLTGSFQRGLEVRSTAAPIGLEPQLEVTTPDPAPLGISIISLPQNGTLLDSTGAQITSVPTALLNPFNVTYIPNSGFTGPDTFEYEVNNIDTGLVDLIVGNASCIFVGRDPNCAPNQTQ